MSDDTKRMPDFGAMAAPVPQITMGTAPALAEATALASELTKEVLDQRRIGPFLFAADAEGIGRGTVE